jgi:hypothetical protein
LVCLAYLALWSYGFGGLFCRLSSTSICIIFFSDKIVWARKWFGYFQTKVFLYDDIAQVVHRPRYLANGMENGRGLYIDGNRLLAESERAGTCQWLYFLIKTCTSAWGITFFDADQVNTEP